MRFRPWELAAIYIIVAVMFAAFVGPILWLVSVSLQTRSSLFGAKSFADMSLTLEHYEAVLTSPTFLSALLNSIIIGLSTVVLSLVAGVPAAYALSVGRFRGRQAFLISLVVMRMLPGIALLIPLYIIYRVTGLLNTRTAIVLAYSSFCVPLVIWIMKNFFDDVPRELEESAVVDGAGRLTAFLAIILPMVRPGIVAVAILTLLAAWNEFLLAVVLTNNRTVTLPVFMAGYSSETGVDWGQLAAAGILVTVPVIAFSFLVQKHLVSGLSAGAVKG
jgi:ABC-type glycerol-3-phosphate transport system permease component